jgi:hypothetical protein
MYAKHETRETKSVTWFSDYFIYKYSRSLSGSFIDLDMYSVGFRSVCWQNCPGATEQHLPYRMLADLRGATDQQLPFRMLAELRVPLTNTFRSLCWQNCGCHWPTPSVLCVGRTAGATDQHLPFLMLAGLLIPLTNTFLSACWQNCGCHWTTPSFPHVGRTADVTDQHLPFRMLAELRVPLTNTFLSVCWQNCGCLCPTPSAVSPAEYLCNAFRIEKPLIHVIFLPQR